VAPAIPRRINRPAQAREQLAVRPMRLFPAARCKQNPGACSAPFRSLTVPRALGGTPGSPRRGPRPGPRLQTRRVLAQGCPCQGTAGRAKPVGHRGVGERMAFIGACLPRRRVRTAPRPPGPVRGPKERPITPKRISTPTPGVTPAQGSDTARRFRRGKSLGRSRFLPHTSPGRPISRVQAPLALALPGPRFFNRSRETGNQRPRKPCRRALRFRLSEPGAVDQKNPRRRYPSGRLPPG
jgi:hypothetical protein